MKVKKIFCIFLFLFTLFLYPTMTRAQEAVEGELLLKFKTSVAPVAQSQILQTAILSLPPSVRPEIKTEATRELSQLDIIKVYLPNDVKDIFAALLAKQAGVEFVEKNYIGKKTSTANDPFIADQWALFKIQAANSAGESAWNATHADGVKVAVLDTGIYKSHADLLGKVILEKDFAGTASPLDNDGHGTHVAGTICATTNNNIGVAGIGYNCTLLNGKVLDDSGYGTYSGIASGIIWAADNGAKVINLSLGGTADSSTLKGAIDYAVSKGVVMVAAAGNESSSAKLYPAGYPATVSVSATDQNDQKPSWANFGTWIDVTAPGVSILSTYKNGNYAYYSGTSMATSVVSGVAALEWGSGNCTTAACVVDVIQETADPITGTGTNWIWGRVNAMAAVKKQSAASPSATPTPTPTATPTPTQTPTPSPTPTSGPSLTPTVTPTPTPTPSQVQQVMTVSSIDASYSKIASFRNISVKAKVINKTTSAVLASAKVFITLKTPSGRVYTSSPTTSSSGTASTTFWWLMETGGYQITVDNVTKTGYSYSPTQTSKTLTVD